jgi:hypothetical protein
MRRSYFGGWLARMLASPLHVRAWAGLKGPGTTWHRVGPREHIVYVIRGSSDAAE